MSGPAAIALAAALALLVPLGAARVLEGRAPPRSVASLYALALLTMVLTPAALLLCVAGPGSLVTGACQGGGAGHGHQHGHGEVVRWAALGGAAGLLGWVSSAAASVVRATRRACPGSMGLVRRSGGEARGLCVLPTDLPVAFTTGIARAQVVISEGLMALLDEEERRAVLAHEFAHARAGHPRLLFVGRVAIRAFGRLAAARDMYASLRRALEAAADDEAVRAVGDPVVVARTIAKVGLAGRASPGGAVAAGESDLAYRIRRLITPPQESRARGAAAWMLAAFLGLALVVAQCGAVHPGAPWLGLLACSVVVGWLGLHPLRSLQTVPEVSAG